jgi:hypothetical protein
MTAESDRLELTGDERLLAELVRGASLVDAAKAAEISERTARRRVADPEFGRRLAAARRELRDVIVARLGALADEALATLRELLGSETPAPQRLGAAREALRALAVLGELADAGELAGRLEAIERRLGLAVVDGEAAA